MLTPRFSLSQDAGFLYINIIAPYIKVAESECYINENEFYFYSQPYYLRLHLPGRILDDHLSTCHYDVDSGALTVRVAKETKGEVFDNLDMLTNLLTPKNVVNGNEEIEVIDGFAPNEEEEFDWHFEFPIAKSPTCDSLISGSGYGFANRKSNVLNEIVKSLPDVLDLKDPDNVPVNERRLLREQQEHGQFNCEHYLADFFDDEFIQEIISPAFPQLTGTVGMKSVFSETESAVLLQLPRREYILDSSQLRTVYLGLVDLVFAYAYSFRFSKGESNVESDWIICKLSSTLSWFDSFENLQDVIVSCARRSLCFPLYRNWTLFHRVLSDVKTIFLTGKPQILKCLLDIRRVLAESDTRYPLNDLYITDYCVWLQGADSKNIESLAKTLDEVNISKSDLGLSLDDMEADARKLVDECAEENCSRGDDDKVDDIERLANALTDIVRVKDDAVVDSDDDDDCENDDNSDEDDDSGGDSVDDDDSGGDDDDSDSSDDDDCDTDVLEGCDDDASNTNDMNDCCDAGVNDKNDCSDAGVNDNNCSDAGKNDCCDTGVNDKNDCSDAGVNDCCDAGKNDCCDACVNDKNDCSDAGVNDKNDCCDAGKNDCCDTGVNDKNDCCDAGKNNCCDTGVNDKNDCSDAGVNGKNDCCDAGKNDCCDAGVNDCCDAGVNDKNDCRYK